jgi:hypothetical protein
MQNQNPVFQDENLNAYFNTLPKTVQESIMQSGVKMYTVQDMQKFAEQYMGK